MYLLGLLNFPACILITKCNGKKTDPKTRPVRRNIRHSLKISLLGIRLSNVWDAEVCRVYLKKLYKFNFWQGARKIRLDSRQCFRIYIGTFFMQM